MHHDALADGPFGHCRVLFIVLNVTPLWEPSEHSWSQVSSGPSHLQARNKKKRQEKNSFRSCLRTLHNDRDSNFISAQLTRYELIGVRSSHELISQVGASQTRHQQRLLVSCGFFLGREGARAHHKPPPCPSPHLTAWRESRPLTSGLRSWACISAVSRKIQ